MINWRLWLGLILVAFLVFIAVFGPELTPYSLDHKQPHAFVKTSHGTEYMIPPYPPSSKYWFGTDPLGRDIFSILLYRARTTLLTILIVSIARVTLGGLLGMWSGISRTSESFRKSKWSFKALGGFPSFLIVYFCMQGLFNPHFSALELKLIQWALIVLVGIPGIYGAIREKTYELNKKIYMEASVTLGGRKFHLIRRHILPHLKGNFLNLFVSEMIMTLALLGQLGIFGGTSLATWATILGEARRYLYGDQWIFIFPLCAVSFTIVSFYLLSLGLQKRQKQIENKAPNL